MPLAPLGKHDGSFHGKGVGVASSLASGLLSLHQELDIFLPPAFNLLRQAKRNQLDEFWKEPLMNKTILPLICAISFTHLAARADGYAFFSGLPRSVWDGFNQPTSKVAPTINVGLFWGTGTPLVDSIATSTPTNSALGLGFAAVTAWVEILYDPNFQLAMDSKAGVGVVQTVSALGSWFYTTTGGVINFPIQGTTDQTTYTMFVVGWDHAYPTPQAAAAANSPVGWSAPFSYTLVNEIGTPPPLSAAGFTPFGVPVMPEPGVISLVALGFSGLLVTRRRRK